MTRPPYSMPKLLGLVFVAGAALACGTAAGSAATAKTGISAEFKAGADTLFNFIDDQLRIARDDATRDTHAIEARRQLAALRAQVTTDADGNVLLLLAMFMGKVNQRLILVFMDQQGVSSRTIKSEIGSLRVQAENCDSELRLWLASAPGEQKHLMGGPCLKEARAAAAALNLKLGQ